MLLIELEMHPAYLFAEFVMDEQFANHVHLQICIGHAPNLAVRKWFQAGTRSRFGFKHKTFCKFAHKLTSQIVG